MKREHQAIEIDIRSWAQCSGSYVGVALDPVDRVVYAWGGLGSAVPTDVAHARHLHLLRISADTSEDALAAWLAQRSDVLRAIADQWTGNEWDRSNMVGMWGQRADDLAEWLQDEWDAMPAETITDADEWFRPAYDAVLAAVLVDGNIRRAAELEVAEAAGDALLDVDDVARSLFRMVGRFERQLIKDFCDQYGRRWGSKAREKRAQCRDTLRQIRMTRALLETA